MHSHCHLYLYVADGKDTADGEQGTRGDTSSKRSGSEDGLGAGAVAAIVVVLLLLLAVAVAVIGVVLVLLYCYRLRMAVAKKVTDYGMYPITIEG